MRWQVITNETLTDPPGGEPLGHSVPDLLLGSVFPQTGHGASPYGRRLAVCLLAGEPEHLADLGLGSFGLADMANRGIQLDPGPFIVVHARATTSRS